jgi:hypothetical protein
MLISIGNDMAFIYLCGGLCGIDVKFMLVNIKFRLKLRFKFCFAMLGNPHKRKKGQNSMLASTRSKRKGGWVDPISFPLSHPHKIFSPTF